MSRPPTPTLRLYAWVLGLAVGAWIGTHRHASDAGTLAWVVLAALAGATLLVLGTDSRRP